jgi:hypothetical protein
MTDQAQCITYLSAYKRSVYKISLTIFNIFLSGKQPQWNAAWMDAISLTAGNGFGKHETSALLRLSALRLLSQHAKI